MRASSLAAMAQTQAKKPIVSAGRARDDLRPAGESARDRRAGDRRRRRPDADRRSAPRGADRGEGARDPQSDRCTASSPTAARGFVYVQRKAPPKLAAQLDEAPPRRLHLRAGPEARLSAGHGRGAGARLRGHGQHRPLGARARAEQGARRGRRAARPSCATRSARPSTRSRSARRATAGTSSSRSTATSRRTPSRCSSRPCAQWHAKDATAIVLDPQHGRDPRDGAGAGLRRERLPGRDGARSHGRPRGERRLRAGLGVQGRDDRRRALASTTSRRTRRSRFRTRSRSPTA